MKKLILQLMILFILIADFIRILHEAVNGAEAEAPTGFSGVIITIIAFIICLMIYHGAAVYFRCDNVEVGDKIVDAIDTLIRGI